MRALREVAPGAPCALGALREASRGSGAMWRALRSALGALREAARALRSALRALRAGVLGLPVIVAGRAELPETAGIIGRGRACGSGRTADGSAKVLPAPSRAAGAGPKTFAV